eukprot:gene20831-32120_t
MRWGPLHFAIERHKLDVVRFLLEAGADAGASGAEQWTTLHFAAELGTGEIVRLLLARGASPRARNCHRRTPLHVAAACGNVSCVFALLDAGSDPNATDICGMTPLHHAAETGHLQAVRALVTAGARIELTDLEGWTALHFAAEAGFQNVAEYLLSKGALIDRVTNNGSSPLHYAVVDKEKSSVARLLLESGSVSMDAIDCFGRTPLHRAARHGKTRAVQLLLRYGASLDSEDTRGCRPIDVSSRGDVKERLRTDTQRRITIHLLLESGSVSMDAIDCFGRTPLHRAARHGKTRAVQLLL